MSDKMKNQAIIVLTTVACLRYLPPFSPRFISPQCACFVYAQTLISSLHQRKIEARKRNLLPKPNFRTICFLTSSIYSCSYVAFSQVSTVSVYCLPTPHNIQKRYQICSPKFFLHAYKNSQQSNFTCHTTRYTNNSCLSFKIKSSSYLHSTIFQ